MEQIEHIGNTKEGPHQHIWKRGNVFVVTSYANAILSGFEILAFPSDGEKVTIYDDLAGYRNVANTMENHRRIAEEAFNSDHIKPYLPEPATEPDYRALLDAVVAAHDACDEVSHGKAIEAARAALSSPA